jgi:hypothetical protein
MMTFKRSINVICLLLRILSPFRPTKKKAETLFNRVLRNMMISFQAYSVILLQYTTDVVMVEPTEITMFITGHSPNHSSSKASTPYSY